MPSALIEAQGLHTYYGSSHVLRGVDFRIAPGETLALMGRNGMGKSTLLKTLLGIVRPRVGRVVIWGRDMTRAACHEIARQGMGYVPEGRGIFPNLSVEENLVMASRTGADGSGHWTLERVLETFPRLRQRIGNGGWQLSGGEQQMLSIGRALMTNPQLLILDEATEGLAPAIAKEIWQIVRDIRATGIATIIVDKNFSALLPLVDRAVILVKGEVVYDDAARDLRERKEFVHQHLGV
jgi:branched-chain amino acid transport system ATP-binding protein